MKKNARITKTVAVSIIAIIIVLSGTILDSMVPVNAASTPDFSISSRPSTLTVPVGTSQFSIITVVSQNSFNGTVELSISNASGIFATLSTTALPINAGTTQPATTTLTITIPTTASTGSIKLTLTGKSGDLTHDTNITIAIIVPDFTITANPSGLIIPAGTTQTSTITVGSLSSFNGTIALSVSEASGVSASLQTSALSLQVGTATSATTTLTLTALPSTVASVVKFSITGTNGSITHIANLSVTVTKPDFSISAKPSTLTVPVGTSQNSTITITSLSSFNGTVTLSTTNSPGIFATLSTTALPINAGTTQPATTTLTITIPTTASTGSIKLTLTGKSGDLTHDTNITIAIIVPDFTITAKPSTMAISAGTAQVSMLTLTSLSAFNGTVELAVSGNNDIETTLPSSVVLSWATEPVSVLALITKIPLTMTTGTYDLTLTATSDLIIHQINITVRVTDLLRIYIRSDGSIDPANSPIQQFGNTYIFNGGLSNRTLEVQRDNVVIDGSGNVLRGTGKTSNQVGILIIDKSNITIRNFTITNLSRGVYIFNSSNIRILANAFVNNGEAISLYLSPYSKIQENYFTDDNTAVTINFGGSQELKGNYIANNSIGVSLTCSDKDNIFENEFANKNSNLVFVYSANNNIISNNFNGTKIVMSTTPPSKNSWNNSTIGNYWSDYNGTDIDHNGIGDCPNVIYANNVDSLPLTEPVKNINSYPVPAPSSLPEATPTSPFANLTSTPSPSPTTEFSTTPETTSELPPVDSNPLTWQVVVLAAIVVLGISVLIFRSRRKANENPTDPQSPTQREYKR